MNPKYLENFVVGREYTIVGSEEYRAPGFGTVARQIPFQHRGKLLRREGDELYFDGFVLHYNGRDPSKPQFTYNGDLVDRIREVENEAGSG